MCYKKGHCEKTCGIVSNDTDKVMLTWDFLTFSPREAKIVSGKVKGSPLRWTKDDG